MCVVCQRKEGKATGAPLGRLVRIFTQPWSYGEVSLLEDSSRVQITFEHLQAKTKEDTTGRWREMPNKKAAKSGQEGFKICQN